MTEETDALLARIRVIARYHIPDEQNLEKFISYVEATKKTLRYIESRWDDCRDEFPASVLGAVYTWGRETGVEIWHDSEELCREVTDHIVRTYFLREVKKKRKLLKRLYHMVYNYLWHKKPLRAYEKLPDDLGRVAGAVFKYKITKNLSDEETAYIRTSENAKEIVGLAAPEQPTDDDIDAWIKEFFKRNPLRSFNSPAIAKICKQRLIRVSERLMYLDCNDPEIWSVSTEAGKKTLYKWCPELGIEDVRRRYAKIVHRMITLSPGLNKRALRQVVRDYAGTCKPEYVDDALDMLRKAGLVQIIGGSNRQKLYHPLPETPEAKKAMKAALSGVSRNPDKCVPKRV